MESTLTPSRNGTTIPSTGRKSRKLSDTEKARRADQQAAAKAAADQAAADAAHEAQVRKLCLGLALACLLPVVALMGVSLPHLADESRRILHCGNAVAWLTAFTFDVSQLIAEVVLVFAGLLALPRKVTIRRVVRDRRLHRDLVGVEHAGVLPRRRDRRVDLDGPHVRAADPGPILTLLYCSAYLAKRAKGHA